MKFDEQGLMPVIVQDVNTLQVLMLGYMNEEALSKTRATNTVTFYSRSKKQLWTKGETSGNFLTVVSIEQDCDQDALLIKAKPQGPTCHRDTTSCFGDITAPGVGFLTYLQQVIASRKDTAEGYTAELFSSGVKRIAQKVGEEGVEVALAATSNDNAELIAEAADLCYHLLVLLEAKDLTIGEVVVELRKRH